MKAIELVPAPPKTVDRKHVADYLASIVKLVEGLDDHGSTLVQSLVEHHDLKVEMTGDTAHRLSLKLRPPDADPTAGDFSVALDG